MASTTSDISGTSSQHSAKKNTTTARDASRQSITMCVCVCKGFMLIKSLESVDARCHYFFIRIIDFCLLGGLKKKGAGTPQIRSPRSSFDQYSVWNGMAKAQKWNPFVSLSLSLSLSHSLTLTLSVYLSFLFVPPSRSCHRWFAVECVQWILTKEASILTGGPPIFKMRSTLHGPW